MTPTHLFQPEDGQHNDRVLLSCDNITPTEYRVSLIFGLLKPQSC